MEEDNKLAGTDDATSYNPSVAEAKETKANLDNAINEVKNIADNIQLNETPKSDNAATAKQSAGVQRIDNAAMASMYLSRLSRIMFNLTIAFIILVSSTFFVGILGMLAFVVGFLLILGTLGIILLMFPGYWDGLMNISKSSGEILNYLQQIIPVAAPIGLGVSIATLVLLCCNKQDRSIPRIVFASIFVAVLLVLTILALGGNGNA